MKISILPETGVVKKFRNRPERGSNPKLLEELYTLQEIPNCTLTLSSLFPDPFPSGTSHGYLNRHPYKVVPCSLTPLPTKQKGNIKSISWSVSNYAIDWHDGWLVCLVQP